MQISNMKFFLTLVTSCLFIVGCGEKQAHQEKEDTNISKALTQIASELKDIQIEIDALKRKMEAVETHRNNNIATLLAGSTEQSFIETPAGNILFSLNKITSVNQNTHIFLDIGNLSTGKLKQAMFDIEYGQLDASGKMVPGSIKTRKINLSKELKPGVLTGVVLKLPDTSVDEVHFLMISNLSIGETSLAK